MTVNDFLLDFAVASVFIMLGQLLRAKIKFFQRFFIPASMLAGFMGLAFRYLLPGFLPMSDKIGSYPTMLILIIFAGVGLNGFSMNKGKNNGEVGRMCSYLSYKMVAQVIQYGLAPAFSILLISKLWPEINYGFGLLLAAGFSGVTARRPPSAAALQISASLTRWISVRHVPRSASLPECSAACSSLNSAPKRAGPNTSAILAIFPAN